jgi:amidase
VPLPDGLAEHWYGLTVAGPIARTAADAAVALAVLTGDPASSTPAPPPGGRRVAVSLRSPSPIGRAGADQRGAVATAAAALSAAGHTARSADPPYPTTLLQQWGRLWHAGIAEEAGRLGLDPRRLEPRTAAMVAKGRRILRRGGPRPVEASAWQQQATAWFADHDVLICPVVAGRPGPAGALNNRGYLTTYLASARAVPFTQAWNLAGFPAVVVPVGVSGGLPTAVQLVAPPGCESLLLGLAGQLEQFLADRPTAFATR